MAFTAFKITAVPGGEQSVVVDGQDVSDRVAEVVVQTGASPRIPQVTLTHFGPVAIEGEGIVTVVREPDGGDVAAAVVEFLESIDPDGLAALVEARFTSLASSPISLTLQTILDMAREVAGG